MLKKLKHICVSKQKKSRVESLKLNPFGEEIVLIVEVETSSIDRNLSQRKTDC